MLMVINGVNTMLLKIWLVVITSITGILVIGQIFVWQPISLVNIAIALGVLWSVFLVNTQEILRFVEVLIIEILVKILDGIALLQGYKVLKADGSLLEQVYQLRHKVYLEIGYIDGEKEHGIFVDGYDPFATNLVVLKDNQIVGTLRLIFYNKSTQLSTLNYFNVDIPKDDLYDYVDIGRWVHEPEYRAKKKKSPIVTVLLGLKLYLYLLKTRKRFIIVTLKSRLKTYIEKIFNVQFTIPNLLPLTSEHKRSREEIKGYFSKKNDIEVCVLEIKTSYLWKFLYRI
jgi:N-acyl-L-homoserine lactone synthetase